MTYVKKGDACLKREKPHTLPPSIQRTASVLHTHYKEEGAYEKCASSLHHSAFTAGAPDYQLW
jgi:hypothetical protein